MSRSIIWLVLSIMLPLGLSAADLCALVLSDTHQRVEIKDLNTFGQAMTEGMLLSPDQDSLFDIYRVAYFGDPNTSLGKATLKSVHDLLRDHPELEKPQFREQLISKVEKIYEMPEALTKYLRSQIKTAGQVRSNLLQIEENLGFWRKILDYQDAPLPENLNKEQQKELTQKRNERFQKYLQRIISKKNRALIADLKSDREDYQKKVKALFATLKEINQWMAKKGRRI